MDEQSQVSDVCVEGQQQCSATEQIKEDHSLDDGADAQPSELKSSCKLPHSDNAAVSSSTYGTSTGSRDESILVTSESKNLNSVHKTDACSFGEKDSSDKTECMPIGDCDGNNLKDKSCINIPEGCEECKDISLEDFEMDDDLSDSLDSHICDNKEETDASSEKETDMTSTAPDHVSETPQPGRTERAPSPAPCTLRHRLDPEPPRSDDPSIYNTTEDDDTVPKTSSDARKLGQIQKALDADPVDLESLRKLAISPGGLINKQMRQRVWPLLINVNTANIPPKPSQEEMEAMTKTYNQVVMDVNRSSSRFPPGIDDYVRMSMKDKLVDLIMRVMLHHKGQLKYYQGFHDVCVTFLLCMDEDMSFAMVNKLAIGYMREYLDETMERTSLLLNYIYPIINRCNPELCQHMQRNDLGTIFALSWVITWFSHVLGDIRRILRVFDFFLASHRMMPVYLSVALVLHRENDIFECGDEMGYIHKCLTVMPPDLPIEALLERAGDLYLQYPPTELSRDPMLIQLNSQVYEHFNLIESRNARRLAMQRQQHNSDIRNRLFVKLTMWTVTAVVVVAAAVVYHAYSSEDWVGWSPFSGS